MDLAGKTAFVTGATGGIGRAICLALADAGADVGVCYHSKHLAAKTLQTEIEKKGRRAVAVQADVSSKDQVFAAIDAVRQELGAIDVLVNNAAITMVGKVEELAEADWDRCLAVNLKSAFLCTQAVLPEMKARRHGWIVNITSLGAKVGGVNAAVCYSVSKAGLACLTIQTAKETLAYGINVNGVSPGAIDTPLQDVYGPEKKEAAYKALARGPGRPEDVAAAVVFLVSPGARYITGEILDVNGGAFMD